MWIRGVRLSSSVGCLKWSHYHHRGFPRLVTLRFGSVGQNVMFTICPSLAELALQHILRVNAKDEKDALLIKPEDLEKNKAALQKQNEV